MHEWLRILQERDDKIAELEQNFQRWSSEDARKIQELERQVTKLRQELAQYEIPHKYEYPDAENMR